MVFTSLYIYLDSEGVSWAAVALMQVLFFLFMSCCLLVSVGGGGISM